MEPTGLRRAALRLSMVTETAVMKVIRTRIPMTDISNADKASCSSPDCPERAGNLRHMTPEWKMQPATSPRY